VKAFGDRAIERDTWCGKNELDAEKGEERCFGRLQAEATVLG